MLAFQYPWVLWGLLGLAVPVILHLIQREIHRPLRFPSVRFILKGKLPFQKRRFPRDLLLLALRLLLLAALIFALARPEWRPREVAAAPGDHDRVVFLVDLSASMSGWNSWEEAKQRVRALREQHAGAEFGLVLSSDRVVDAIGPAAEASVLDSAMEANEPEMVAGDHREGLRSALNLLGDAAAARTLYVVSDLQAGAWEPDGLPEVARSIELEWVRVGDGRDDNVAVMRARAYPGSGDTRHVQAELRNFGADEVTRTATLTLGGSTWEQEVTLPPGRSAEVSFDVEAADASRGRVTVGGDAFEADNDYHFWAGRPPALRVLAIVPLTDEPSKAEELFFLRSALETRGEIQWLSFEVETVEPGATPDDWSPYQAVFALGAGAYFDAAEWERFGGYLEEGGVAVLTPGETPGRLTGLLREQGLLEAEYLGTARVDRRGPTGLALDWIDPDSPLGGVFTDEAARSLQMARFYRYLRLDVRDGAAEVWLRSSADEPLLVTRAQGRGRLFFMPFALATSWSDLPLSGGFLPLVRELIAGDISADHGIVREETGFSRGALAARLGVPETHPFLDGIPPRTPGIYAEWDRPVEVNLSRRESVLETASVVDLARALRPRADGTEAAAAAVRGLDDGRARPLWHWFALAAGLLFLAEMLAAAAADRGGSRLTAGAAGSRYKEVEP